VSTRLPPTLGFFRDFARLFVSRLCAIGDLEERRDDVREAMRLRSGAARADGEAAAAPDRSGDWSRVVAGGWLEETLDGLRRPEGLAAASRGAALKTTLRPYQEVAVRRLWFLSRLGLGTCLADDMGLGKTLPLYWTKVP